MMSPAECRLKSAQCEISADHSATAELRANWLRLASDWRDMADDGETRSTTARLMAGRRAE